VVVASIALASAAQTALDRTALHEQLDGPATTIEQYERIREALRQSPAPGKATLVSAHEPGQKLIVTGTLRDAAGKPIPGALLHVFQTDAQGHYTRAKVMDEPHARLFEFIRTGADGRFEFSTIRPGGYPGRPDRQGEEWRIPSHVHFEIDAGGFAHRGFQMVFEDDPRMTPYWHEWARKGRHPVVKVTHGPDGVDRVVNDIVLAAG
jgi:protocatechuate 3,4-dioxygenase beta subunit